MFFLSCVNTKLMVFSTVLFLRFSRRAISSLDRPSFRLMLNMVLFCGGRLAMVVSMRLSNSLAYISCSTEVDCGAVSSKWYRQFCQAICLSNESYTALRHILKRQDFSDCICPSRSCDIHSLQKISWAISCACSLSLMKPTRNRSTIGWQCIKIASNDVVSPSISLFRWYVSNSRFMVQQEGSVLFFDKSIFYFG